ncbi:MAG: hydantoinase/oxoprolinase family protein [Microthrixaceae bacterium]|nr:hydantoinase/oxoprolinase family protein [Microthrixaceae bacterium]
MRVGADSGGTFTDLVLEDGRILKVPSTPDDPGAAVREGLGRLAAGGAEVLAHGTTVATNALLEGNLARVALYTTAAFTDVIEIARQDRPSLYDPFVDRPEPLVARPDRIEVHERVAADATVLSEPDPEVLPDPSDGVEAVAVCLLHSDLRPDHERMVASELRGRGWDVTASSEVSPEYREYERTVTTVLNAALRPVCADYLSNLEPVASEVAVMTSAGSLVGIERAASVPVSLLLSGPAGGARAAAAVARACGFGDALAFDMGGTSTDVCLIRGGEPEFASQHVVGGHPVRLPAVAVHTVGAGGGSIAAIDPGGALQVGPASAGAVPGPACYGRGGTAPTVTDANLLLGRIPPGTAFSGLGDLDEGAARRAMEDAGVDPAGVVEVVNATMVQALRRVSVQRGVDPSGLALVAYGGAGPLHACELAEDLGVRTVLVPALAGVLSAVGLLTSPRGVELVASWPTPLEHTGLVERAKQLEARAQRILDGFAGVGRERHVEVYFDCRYAGQSHDLRVGSVAEFHDRHESVNGYARPGDPVEVTAVRVTVNAAAPLEIDRIGTLRASGESEGEGEGEGRVHRRAEVFEGPRVVTRDDCTIWVPEGWRATPGPLSTTVLERVGTR